MPTQTRGFFSCDFCSIVLDTLEEATEHEASCQKRPQQSHRPPGPPYYPSRHPGGPHYGNMAPLSTAELERYGHPHHYPHGGTPHHGTIKLRALPLMGPERSGAISPEDVVACQNIELFEASPDIAADFDGSRSGGTPVVPKQVGIRCAHCATSNQASNYAIIFPASLGSIATNVRVIADNHLGTCQMAPPDIRDACKRAAKRRQEASSQERRNGGDEDERSRMALVDYCVGFCQHWGIINKQPFKGGIAFGDSEMPPGFPPTPAETPASHRGPPSGPYSGERMGPPMSYDRMPYRPGMPPMMGGPGDSIAPTPLQRRRDPPNYSADRSEGGGYPTPYSHGPHGEGGYGGHEMQTPAQPNFEGKEGGPTPRSGPHHPGHPQESPPGYGHYELPHNFPFYMESDRTWHCKFCSHIHPSYREPQSIWSSANGGPPPGSFIDSHLSMCRSYHQSIPSPPSAYHGPYGMPPPYMNSYPPPPGWEGSQHSPPPGGPMHPPHPPYPPQAPQGPPPSQDPHQQYPYAPAPADEYGNRAMMGGPVARPPPRKVDGDAIRNAVSHLASRENDYYSRNPTASKSDQLVLNEDKLLLTDYFYFLMKQLRLCRFSEADRKTRGGKREKIKIGYGGLQCIHCSDIPNSRKFFWSNVDRLANSFAEIPGHVLKCRRCPMQTKEALLQLKQFHPEQMARLPRGSQKVFFRRMWRRLHDDDQSAEASAMADLPGKPKVEDGEDMEENETTPKKSSSLGEEDQEKSPGDASHGDDSALILERSTLEAAKVLADSANSAAPSSPSSKVLLSVPDDANWLSDSDCFIRKQLEVFVAQEEDVATAQADKKYPIHVGQVGIRCIHCAMASNDSQGASGTAVAFPFAVSGIYEAVREFQRLHLDTCDNVPEATKEKLAAFKGASSLSSVLRKYYVLAAKALGLHDTKEGIRAGGEAAPLGPEAAFFFAEGSTSLVSDEAPATTPPVKVEPTDDEAPATTSPSKDGPADDEAPATTSPSKDEPADDEAPGTTSPSKDEPADDEAPATTSPSKDGPADDEAPGTTSPSKDEPTDDEAPTTTSPSKDGPADDEAPGMTSPSKDEPADDEALTTTSPGKDETADKIVEGDASKKREVEPREDAEEPPAKKVKTNEDEAKDEDRKEVSTEEPQEDVKED